MFMFILHSILLFIGSCITIVGMLLLIIIFDDEKLGETFLYNSENSKVNINIWHCGIYSFAGFLFFSLVLSDVSNLWRWGSFVFILILGTVLDMYVWKISFKNVKWYIHIIHKVLYVLYGIFVGFMILVIMSQIAIAL
jgi:hypothetical protein